MAAPHHTSDLIGGRYRLEGMIASGGMADVWRATDLTLGRIVAVKMLREDIADDVVTKERFRREAQALARLTHPHIVPVYDCIDEHDQVALVMRLIEGKSLRGLLDENGNVVENTEVIETKSETILPEDENNNSKENNNEES